MRQDLRTPVWAPCFWSASCFGMASAVGLVKKIFVGSREADVVHKLGRSTAREFSATIGPFKTKWIFVRDVTPFRQSVACFFVACCRVDFRLNEVLQLR